MLAKSPDAEGKKQAKPAAQSLNVQANSQYKGPGIPDIELAMQEGYSTATPEMRELGFGAGMGLPNIRRNSDTFEITSEAGRGTRLRARVELT